MKPCPHHYDPTCEDCKAFHAQEKKKVESRPEPVSGPKPTKVRKEESTGKKSRFLNLPRILTILGFLGLVFVVCWGCVPGFLKPDREVQLEHIASSNLRHFYGPEYAGDICESVCLAFRVSEDDQYEVVHVSRFSINIQLRKDGMLRTTLLLKGRKTLGSDKYASATILVPNQEDLKEWEQCIEDMKAEWNKKCGPRRVFPDGR